MDHNHVRSACVSPCDDPEDQLEPIQLVEKVCCFTGGTTEEKVCCFTGDTTEGNSFGRLRRRDIPDFHRSTLSLFSHIFNFIANKIVLSPFFVYGVLPYRRLFSP
jgi:hypothetical protein